MPRTRWALTRAAQDKYLADAKWLASAGAAIEIPEPILSEPSPLRIDQYGPQYNHIVFNPNQFRVGVIVGVRLLALRSGIEICDCHFALPREDPELILWDVSGESPRYRLTKGLEFDREEVLNSRIDEGLSPACGQTRGGTSDSNRSSTVADTVLSRRSGKRETYLRGPIRPSLPGKNGTPRQSTSWGKA
jgi:hypothetical protein